MLVCRDVTEMTTDYLDNVLPWSQRFAMRFHLSICSLCRRYLRQVRQTIALLRHIPGETIAAALEDRLVAEATSPSSQGRATIPPLEP